MRNPLLARRQAIVDVIHPGRGNLPTGEIQDRIAKMYKADTDAVFTFGFRTAFGGGRSTGFVLIYESAEAARRYEPKHRLLRKKLIKIDPRPGRKSRKEKKNKLKRIRGTAKSKASLDKKKK